MPNQYGGRENLNAVEFLKQMNVLVGAEYPGAVTIAEESTSWPGVSRPVDEGGLGFGYKWNMGWMHDTLDFGGVDPLYRKYSQDQLTFSFMYAFSENFVLPYSHDEVVHLKGAIVAKMTGDRWQHFANVRLLYGYMFAHPGKKLLFMGDEFAQEREWNHDRSLDWHLLGDGAHAGVANLVRDLNNTYRGLAALHRYDCEARGVDFLVSDKEANVVGFARYGDPGDEPVISIGNYTPVVRHGYRIGVPLPGEYREAINTDDERYGGSGVMNGTLRSEPIPWHGKDQSIALTLPPLATLLLAYVKPPAAEPLPVAEPELPAA